MIDAGWGAGVGNVAASLSGQQFFLFHWLQDDSLETWPDTVAGQLECFYFLFPINNCTTFISNQRSDSSAGARGPAVSGRGQLSHSQLAEVRGGGGRIIRNIIPFQEAEGSQGLWGCWVGKLDRGSVRGWGWRDYGSP